MQTFKELYDKTVQLALKDKLDEVKNFEEDYNPYHLDCLLHPEKHPIIFDEGKCDCPEEEQKKCIAKCPFGAMKVTKDGVKIDPESCVGCEECIKSCKTENFKVTSDTIAALKAIRTAKGASYAMIAPAFLGQFSDEITPGKLRTALKMLGFDGMLEVALFADILTLKEALEFDKNILHENDYQLTSCCCPMWIGMIRKIYNQLMPHVPGSVSPMVACGRVVKTLHPDAVTVFIGPCMAKKAEAREKDVADAVDYVLTFQEVQSLFDLMDIDPAKLEESDKDHSSRAGRIYARTGGVSEAVENTLKAINPNREIHIKTKQADGVPDCKKMIKEILDGESNANFYEGMGCVGGCVGGPKSVTGPEHGTKIVNKYGDEAPYKHPIENPYVIELMHRLGFDTIEDLLEETDLFTRHF